MTRGSQGCRVTVVSSWLRIFASHSVRMHMEAIEDPNEGQNPADGGGADPFADMDLILYSGVIGQAGGEMLLSLFDTNEPRANVGLILATYGGVADWAYKMARALRARYEKVTVYVLGYCKSAGTLLALGAHEIVMGDRGELGPLDVQVLRGEDFTQRHSGLTIFQTVQELNKQAFAVYESWMLAIMSKGAGAVTFKTASEIAMDAVSAIITPIADKIEPDRLGEMSRSIEIANEYGKLLDVPEEVLRRFTHNYPTHGFVIDREEASSFLPTVCRAPNEAETALARALDALLQSEDGFANASRIPRTETAVIFLNPSPQDDAPGDEPDQNAPGAGAPDGDGAGGSDPVHPEGGSSPVGPEAKATPEAQHPAEPEHPDGADADSGGGERGRGRGKRTR